MAPILHFQRYSVLFSPLQRVLFQMVPAELCQLVVCDESCLHSSHRRVSADEEEKKPNTSHCKEHLLGLPWWLSGEKPACQCRRRRFGKIPHTEEQLSQCTPTTEPALRNKRRHCNEQSTRGSETKSECSSKDPAKPKINKLN